MSFVAAVVVAVAALPLQPELGHEGQYLNRDIKDKDTIELRDLKKQTNALI